MLDNIKTAQPRFCYDHVIAIGVSAGGVEALSRMMPLFPQDSPAIVIVQHMPANFTMQLARRLNSISLLAVKEAQDGDPLAPGTALIAPGGDRQMLVRRTKMGDYRIKLESMGKVSGHCPSVDALFYSVAENVGHCAAAAILTGMGGDGAKGMLSIRQAGGRTVAQDEKTSLIFGMPAVAWKMGAAEKLLPLDAIPQFLIEALSTVEKDTNWPY